MSKRISKIKGLLRNVRDGGVASGWNYLLAPKIRSKVKKLAESAAESDFEIHVLAGADRLDMALWMAASWILSTGRNWRFIFHSDGRDDETELEKVPQILPSARFISDEDSGRLVSKQLERFPLCLQCRNLHPLCRKLFDIPLFSSGEKFLAIDTDILFFREPKRLMNWIRAGEGGTLFMRDVSDSTLPGLLDWCVRVGVEIRREVNTGIIAMPRKACAPERIEECLRATNLLSSPKWFVEQSLYAFLGSVQGQVELLNSNPQVPDCHQLDLGDRLSNNSVLRHYVGKVRHLYYSEGIPIVKQMFKNGSCIGC